VKAIQVEWVDAHTVDEWQELSSVTYGLVNVTSIGFLLKETEDALVLCGSIGDHDDIFSQLSIPKVCIKKRRFIKL
jgi:hypothetical protein